MIPQPIVDAVRAGKCLVLPDRSGWLVFLGDHAAGVGCPWCDDGHAMGLCVVRQELDPWLRWVYSCLLCVSGPPVAAAA